MLCCTVFSHYFATFKHKFIPLHLQNGQQWILATLQGQTADRAHFRQVQGDTNSGGRTTSVVMIG